MKRYTEDYKQYVETRELLRARLFYGTGSSEFCKLFLEMKMKDDSKNAERSSMKSLKSTEKAQKYSKLIYKLSYSRTCPTNVPESFYLDSFTGEPNLQE